MNRMAFVLFGFAVVSLAHATSFDCLKASTKVEHIICDNPEISKLDDVLAASYKAALQDKSKAESVKHTQYQWMNERNRCSDLACVKRAYETRSSALGSTGVTKANPEHQMIQAITKNDIETVKGLLNEGTLIPHGNYLFTPIDIAARNNNTEMLALLLGNGADPEQDIEAMKASLKTCNMKIVSLLVDHGYKVKGNPSYYGPYDPVPWAALFGCTDIIKYFVSKGADVNFDNPLRQAANQCHVDTAEYLLSRVQDPDIPDGDHRTPLWADKRKECMVVINDLLRAGANPERALLVPTENPALKLPRDDKEIMKLLQSRPEANKK
jgi:uncharacterized protein